MNANFEGYRNRLKARHGEKFSDVGLSQQFAKHFGHRVEVKFDGGTIKRGWISGTTGWRPSLMLLLRRNSSGSSWLLNDKDTLLRVLDVAGR